MRLNQHRKQSGTLVLLLLLAAAIFVASAERLKSVPRQSVTGELRVALPMFVQVLMSMGDRYLAANMATIRSVIAATSKMQSNEFGLLARIQRDVAWFNPAHEDNYYTAAAILPQYGEIDAAQSILARASRARYFDYQPAFYYGFNQWYYKGDPVGAASWMIDAAKKLPDPEERLIMQNMAARWMDKAQDTELAIRVVEAMAKEARRKDFRDYLELRVVRLRQLDQLRKAAATYREHVGRPLERLDQLMTSGAISQLPVDPFGFGFGVSPQGEVFLRSSVPKS